MVAPREREANRASRILIAWRNELGLDQAGLVSLLEIFGELLPDPLSRRIELAAYAAKLLDHGEIATAVVGGRVVGFAAMYANDRVTRRAYISILTVLPEWHRRGIGRALLSRLLARARRNGMHSCDLLVLARSAGALSFYRSAGFRVVETGGEKLRMRCELPGIVLPKVATPIEEHPRLKAALDLGIDLRIKRDDLYPASGGGTKARKMQYILRDAIAGGHDVIVTNGRPDSNHARAAAVLAAELGIECHVVLVVEPGSALVDAGNLLLTRMSGATIEACRKEELAERMDLAVDGFRRKGRKPMYVWGGGHGLAGAQALVDAAAEARAQCGDWIPDCLIVASGTGSTQAGLALGYAESRTRVVGISVARGAERGARVVRELIAEYLHRDSPETTVPSKVEVEFRDDWSDGGHEQTSPPLLDIVRRSARAGLLVDPTYSGKALRGLVELVRRGEIEGGSRVLFWHSGGLLNLQSSCLAGGSISP